MTTYNNSKTITAVIVAKNEELKIADSIESVLWCTEVIVVDTGSTDKTIDIAKKLGAKVVSYKGEGSYDKWRDEGLMNVTTPWLLYLDADERISSDLEREICKFNLGVDLYSACAIPRKNIIFGKEFKHGGEYPDYQIRLFRTSKLKGWSGSVHEVPTFDGDLGYLKNSIIHLKHNSLSEMIDKTNRWSEIEAKLMYDSDHPKMNIIRFFTAMSREFVDRMIKKQGFRDGAEGVIYSLYQVFSKLTSYAKLWEMQEKN